ncbi:LexA family protein [Streptomyces venezuelae]
MQETGYAPSIREIGDAVGLSSSSSVARQLAKLEDKGHIVRASRRSRGLRLVSQTTGETLLPSGLPPAASSSATVMRTPHATSSRSYSAPGYGKPSSREPP